MFEILKPDGPYSWTTVTTKPTHREALAYIQKQQTEQSDRGRPVLTYKLREKDKWGR